MQPGKYATFAHIIFPFRCQIQRTSQFLLQNGMSFIRKARVCVPLFLRLVTLLKGSVLTGMPFAYHFYFGLYCRRAKFTTVIIANCVGTRYSKVPSLRNCFIGNSGLIVLNKMPLYKKLFRLIHAQFIIQWYEAIL